MEINLPIIAGTVSTIIFALSTLPMLLKAFRTKDLRSYSLGNILLSNVGNVIHALYVFHLPPGPIWLLHTFNLVTTGLMLVWYLRLPGTMRSKHVVFANLKPWLNPGGVVFGTTILSQGIRPNFLARRMMTLYNAKAIFSNREDDLPSLEAALKRYFQNYETNVVGCVAFFNGSI